MSTATSDVENVNKKIHKLLQPIFQRAVQKLFDAKTDEFHKIFESSTYDYQSVDERLKQAKSKLQKLVDQRRKQKEKNKEVENVNSKTLVNEKKSEPFFRL